MAKLARYTQQVFGSGDTGTDFSQFGGFNANVTTLYTGSQITPTLVQGLSNYLQGWVGAVVGNNSPTIQDMNSLCFLFAYQLSYLFQEGIPEYDSGTTYYQYSFCQYNGIVYQYINATGSAGNAPSNAAYWAPMTGSQTFTQNGTFTVPLNVTQVTVTTVTNPKFFNENPNPGDIPSGFFLDPYQTIYAIGGSNSGQLGIGTSTPLSSPVAVISAGCGLYKKIYSSFSDGFFISFITDIQNKLYACGSNTSGQLGIGNVTSQSSPIAVLGGIKFQTLATNPGGAPVAGATVAISNTGTLYGWGPNGNGQLGIGNVTSQSSPVAVVGVAGLTFYKIYAGALYANFIALTTSGAAYAWGQNPAGELGIGNVTTQSSPIAVLGGLSFKKIVTGSNNAPGNFYIGLTTSGSLYAWGVNVNGELGIGNINSQSSPVAVLGGLTFQDVVTDYIGNSSGGSSVCALTTSGVAYSWGSNGNGQLGIGNVTPQSSPVAVLGGLTFTKIKSAGTYGFYGLTASGAMYAWGINTNGQLGNGNTTPQSSPVAVLGGLTFYDFKALGDGSSVGSIHAVTTTGQLYAWGYNGDGELGIGNITPQSSPVAVLGANTIVNIAPSTRTTVISVTPGASVAISIQQLQAYFGTTLVDYGPVDSLTVSYG